MPFAQSIPNKFQLFQMSEMQGTSITIILMKEKIISGVNSTH
jgi:hypothetical protein